MVFFSQTLTHRMTFEFFKQVNSSDDFESFKRVNSSDDFESSDELR